MHALASLIRSGDDVVLSDAFDRHEIVEAAEAAHRHAFAPGDLAELTRLLFAHRTARRIIVASRDPQPLEHLCSDAAAILVPLP